LLRLFISYLQYNRCTPGNFTLTAHFFNECPNFYFYAAIYLLIFGEGVTGERGEGSAGSVGVNSGISAIPEAKPSGVAEIPEFGTPKESLARRYVVAPRAGEGACVRASAFGCSLRKSMIF
jgi:hypothetical protein